MDRALDRGREAFDRRSWAEACAQLSTADRATPLEPEDLERLATASYLAGRDAESADSWARAHREFLGRRNPERAARCAFWLGFELVNNGEHARGGGWFSKAARLLEERGVECVEQGYLLLPHAMQSIMRGDAEASYATFGQAAIIGARFRDTDLVTMARHGQGRALLRMGETVRGLALLDEVMVGVTAGEVSPMVGGDVYCSVIEACHEVFDMRRAQEWTAALGDWCATQPDLVPFRGECMVRRAEVMQLHGDWAEAMDESLGACARLAEPPPKPAIGAALYRVAELHRLRGAFAKADERYREASEHGRKPYPGLALLRLAQGQVEAASATIRRVLDEAKDRRVRSVVLPAYVEIALAAGDVPAARAGGDELSAIAAALDAPFLRAVAAHASGAVLLAEGDARAALGALRDVGDAWRNLDAPYEGARARVLVALACRALGDTVTAEMELDAARRAFQELGAATDLARVEALSPKSGPPAAGGLTARELQVLGLVATGKTNRAIAAALGISERTVARHISNIFTKLGLTSRAAATAYAYEHHLT